MSQIDESPRSKIIAALAKELPGHDNYDQAVDAVFDALRSSAPHVTRAMMGAYMTEYGEVPNADPVNELTMGAVFMSAMSAAQFSGT